MSNKIPNIFNFLLEVKSIDNCINHFNKTISPENKKKLQKKNLK